jgi:tRNA nucleotidyltransferase (CCA-adding enzyme)
MTAPGRAAADVGWSHFPHEADLGVRGVGRTLEEAFANAAMAMTAAAVDPAGVQAVDSVRVVCEAPDRELLLVDWLNAIVYEMATRNMLFARFDVRIEDGRLAGTLAGESRGRPPPPPPGGGEGAPHTALDVHRREDGLWIAQCVVDV